MNTFKTILISALTFITCSWLLNHPFLFGILLFFANNFFWFYISYIGERYEDNMLTYFHDLDLAGWVAIVFLNGILYPMLLIFNVDGIRDNDMDNIWQHFFKKNAPKITFQSPIKIESSNE